MARIGHSRVKLPRASGPIALASAVSLGAQLLFSLAMLRLFAPQAVGEFSVISQIAFFWMTLALAQSPLKLLADIQQPPIPALRTALRSSLLRLALLLPLVWVGVRLSGLAQSGQPLGWAALLALLQLCWYLAQPLTLRIASTKSTALGRALPPIMALVMAGAIGSWLPGAGASALLLAAASGYAVGAMWLLPAYVAAPGYAGRAATAIATIESSQADNRGAPLRMAHAAADALTGTAILLVWQRSHGAAEAGYLAVLLRMLGFVPAVIHTAWAQVLLAHGTSRRRHSTVAGLCGALMVAALALAGTFALRMQWLSDAWNGVLPYMLPLVLWQAAACLPAAFSHRPFEQGRAATYSYAAIGFDALQLLTMCGPLVFGPALSPIDHVWLLAGLSTSGLLALGLWLARPLNH
jgi:hypothetical protein